MRAKDFLHEILSPVIHKKRLTTLVGLVEGLLLNKKLSVTELGRSFPTNASERSAIRRSDRFVGNKNIHSELPSIFKTIAKMLIGNVRPTIIVDWSHVPNTKFNLLRAALTSKGRAITLYEEVHPYELLGNREVEKDFLWKLKYYLPSECVPIIITDAGFHNDWFKNVINLGWGYIGRVRGLKVYKQIGDDWAPCKELMVSAIKKPQHFSNVELCKSENQITTNLVLIKEKRKNDKKAVLKRKQRGGGRDRMSYRSSAMDPWLLATSLKVINALQAKRIIKIYKRRMQIEESFRDLKSTKYGFAFSNAYSRSVERVTILLLIAMLAILIAWLIGYLVESKKMHYQFQVNSIKSKRVLSWIFLGLRAIKRNIFIPKISLFEAMASLRSA